MVTCSVSGCGVNQRSNPDNCTFHRFPLDPIIKGKWLILIGRVGWNPKKNSSICSKHFPDKYRRKIRTNTSLIKGAIPTLFVPGQLKERVTSSYIYRDITPPPSTSEDNKTLTPRKKNLLSENHKLKQKLKEKEKRIRSLVAKIKRQAKKIVTLQDVLKEIHLRPRLKDHHSDMYEVHDLTL